MLSVVYAKCNLCVMTQISPLCWLSLCSMLLCWVSWHPLWNSLWLRNQLAFVQALQLIYAAASVTKKKSFITLIQGQGRECSTTSWRGVHAIKLLSAILFPGNTYSRVSSISTIDPLILTSSNVMLLVLKFYFTKQAILTWRSTVPILPLQ